MTKEEEYELFSAALSFAAHKHAGQERMGGRPYITHPIEVERIVRLKGYGLEYRLAALFHDLLEDTDATEEEILQLGGKDVLEAVKRLTKHKGYVMEEYVAGIRENPIAFVVKGADRLHNLLCCVDTAPDDFKRRYILESLDYYMDFMPEIPDAVRKVAASLSVPTAELNLEYTPVSPEEIRNS